MSVMFPQDFEAVEVIERDLQPPARRRLNWPLLGALAVNFAAWAALVACAVHFA